MKGDRLNDNEKSKNRKLCNLIAHPKILYTSHTLMYIYSLEYVWWRIHTLLASSILLMQQVLCMNVENLRVCGE